MEDIPNTTEELKQRFEELKAAYNGPIELRLSAEYMLDNLFDKRLESGDLLLHSLPNDPRKEILIETSYYNPPMGFWATLEHIKKKGYYPIIAHPERYFYMQEKEYERLRGMGVVFQLNLFALSGGFGHVAQRKAEMLLQKGYYSMMGSDLHRHSVIVAQLNKKYKKSFLPALNLLK